MNNKLKMIVYFILLHFTPFVMIIAQDNIKLTLPNSIKDYPSKNYYRSFLEIPVDGLFRGELIRVC